MSTLSKTLHVLLYILENVVWALKSPCAVKQVPFRLPLGLAELLIVLVLKQPSFWKKEQATKKKVNLGKLGKKLIITLNRTTLKRLNTEKEKIFLLCAH